MQLKERPPVYELPYSAGLMSQSCWFIEFKKIVRLIAEGKTEEEIKRECLEYNLLGTAKEYRAKRMYGYLIKRAAMLDEPLVQLFMNGDIGTQKLINLICIVRGDRLFFEFLNEVYREKSIVGYESLDDADFNTFFRQKGSHSDIVEAWSESTKKHLRSNYTTCMLDAGLIAMKGKQRQITPPVVDDGLIRYMRDCGEESVIKAIQGVA